MPRHGRRYGRPDCSEDLQSTLAHPRLGAGPGLGPGDSGERGVQLTEDLLAHELAHVLQWRALGAGRFVWRYAGHLLRHGYDQNPLEITARAAAQDRFFLAWARGILKSKLSGGGGLGAGTSPSPNPLTFFDG